jgi:hypothetical protein
MPVRKAALIALDQLDGSPLRRGALRGPPQKELRAAAIFVIPITKIWPE